MPRRRTNPLPNNDKVPRPAPSGGAPGAPSPEPEDAAERWGRRIGRGLSVLAVVALALIVAHQLHIF